MNYFEFFGIPMSFLPNEHELKRLFLQNSKKFHPDFYTLEPAEKQAEILELSTFNNQAYRTLSDFDQRMKYILEQKGVLEEEGKNEIPQDFLLEMMDINEAMMELEFDFDENTFQQVRQKIQQLHSELDESIRPVLERFDEKNSSHAELYLVKEFYFKKRYVLRIQENLDKFAPASKDP